MTFIDDVNHVVAGEHISGRDIGNAVAPIGYGIIRAAPKRRGVAGNPSLLAC